MEEGGSGQPPSEPDLSGKQFEMYNFGDYLTPQSAGSRNAGQRTPSRGNTPSVTLDPKISLRQKRAYAHLMDEWFTSPDLLLCIHPSVGSLMVWTVEGLDAPANSSRLVHVSFSSCLPHIFPPHLAQSLKQNLLQFLIKEPDVVHTRESESGNGSVTDISLPVPQIRLQSRANMAALSQLEGVDDVPKIKSDSTLILVSSHINGSLNTWSVELTVQSNQCTSIAGLIHCAGTGGHNWVVRSVHRHPWLPVLMTVSAESEVACSQKRKGSGTDKETVNEDMMNKDTGRGKSEIIIWNADLPGPLEHKSRLNELSRMVALDPHAFRHISWVPPISIGGESNEGAFARCPSSGLFVANVGNELRLFQASLYSITKPQPSSFMHSDFSSSQKAEATLVDATQTADQQDVFVTSQIGKEGISMVSVIEKDLSKFEEVVCLHSFRMCSLVTSFDIKKSLDSKFCKDIVIILIENRTPHTTQSTIGGTTSSDPLSTSAVSASPSSKRTVSYLHMWRAIICTKTVQPESPVSRWGSSKRQSTSGSSLHSQQPITYTASVQKVYSSPLPLPRGTHIIHTSPTCDIASSLQLQLPTLSSPFLFSTTCSDGTIRCWHFSVEVCENGNTIASPPQPPASSESYFDQCACDCDENDQDGLNFRLYEVFESSRPSNSLSTSKFLDCCEEDVIKLLPTESFIPCAITSAYAGRFAMAHQLTKPFTLPTNSGTSSTSLTKGTNPLDRYAVVSVWECESSGGLKWSCEATLMLSTLAGVMTSKANTSAAMSVLMEWLPMENGAYLLATCFGTTLSIFGMALPQDEDQFTTPTQKNSFLPKQKLTTLSKNKSLACWACLLQFSCWQSSMEFPISCLTYTGSNSLLVTNGNEMHLYSCFVKEDQLQDFSSTKKDQRLLKNTSRPFRGRASIKDRKSADSVLINLLDYAHAINTPLPQYHPKILIELMNSSKLHAVKAILINLVKYLLLYSEKNKTTGNYFEEGGVEALYEMTSDRKMPLLSVSADGYLKRSRKIKSKLVVESIPRLALATMGIFGTNEDSAIRPQEGTADATDAEEDDYDELFATSTLTDVGEFHYGFEDEDKMDLLFSDLDPKKDKFTPEMAQKLSSILHYAQLADLSDLEQVRLLAIAETVANTKMSFSEQSGGQGIQQQPSTAAYGANVSLDITIDSSSGAGYASRGLSHGVRGGEAMDDCGLRYLLALENYKTLSESLPDGVSAGSLAPSDFIWAFHSDAELELLSAVPCVQKDELSWAELRNAGVGWWVRSSETLRKLIEKVFW